MSYASQKGYLGEIEPDDNSPAVCDDCWEKIHPSKHVDLYEQAKEIVDKTKKLS